MEAPITVDKLRFLLFSVKDKLWVKPLGFCLLSIFAVFAAKVADGTSLAQHIPEIKEESVQTLLSIMASSMMVIATFSAGTMVNAYASAGQSSTPRSLSLLISDDASQNALSVFIGAFIFSAVALTAISHAFFGEAGLFILLVLTCSAFAFVILTFIRWVDSVARLGRVGSTILKVENATARAIKNRIQHPCLGAIPNGQTKGQGKHEIHSNKVGYIQLIDIAKLQRWADDNDAFINVALLPGEFVTPEKPIAYTNVWCESENIYSAFTIGEERSFEADPRFGFIVLAEIASRALSPAVNDHGTAISIISSVTRLILLWSKALNQECKNSKKHREYAYDRVSLPELSVHDLFDDAYTSIARDGASNIEVALHIQKSLRSIQHCFDKTSPFAKSAEIFAEQCFCRCTQHLDFEDDKTRLQQCYEKRE
ncbi:DUF2254 domain-containing protein [Alteromonas sp. D210916BOD_24]|uniref:DUF2254 domain-containing protein n=1 Tax=Alteromonas sp. D210916BOD_24 TaxID=3157618 RepID=UPI00399C93D3